MTKTIVTQNTPTVPTPLSEAALIWCHGGDKALTAYLIATAPLTCPACGDPCGALINGVCLGCDVEWDAAITAAEARYEAEQGADTCCACGID
jgi:hypothetical protein